MESTQSVPFPSMRTKPEELELLDESPVFPQPVNASPRAKNAVNKVFLFIIFSSFFICAFYIYIVNIEIVVLYLHIK